MRCWRPCSDACLALGLYSLFVDDRTRCPRWLSIHDLGQLGKPLAGVVVVAIAVIFRGQALRPSRGHERTARAPGSRPLPSSAHWRCPVAGGARAAPGAEDERDDCAEAGRSDPRRERRLNGGITTTATIRAPPSSSDPAMRAAGVAAR